MRFLRITSVLLVSLCLIAVFDDCTVYASPNLLAEDDHLHFTAMIAIPVLLAELDLAINSLTPYLTAHESLRHTYCHQTTILMI
jgi:hypothetical protein